MWPLDNAMGATIAHRAPERAVDGTCTWVWVWMTNKCRKRMNEKEEYITTEITQRDKGERKRRRKPRERREALGMQEELGVPVLGRGVLSPWDLGRPILCIFHPQNKLSPHQSPTFRPILYKFIVIGPVRKPSPYNWRRLWKSYSCDDECNSLLRRGQIP